MPNVFRKAGFSNCRVILGCAEVFIEQSKSLDSQTYIWSDYKHHNSIRIHIERAINRINNFRLLKNTLPVSLLRHIDDILRICAALCNLIPKLICSKKEEDKSNA